MHSIQLVDTFLEDREAWLLELFYALQKQGVGVSVATMRRRTRKAFPFQPVFGFEDRGYRPGLYQGDAPRFWARTLRWRRPVIVHAHGLAMAAMGAALAERLSIPWIISTTEVGSVPEEAKGAAVFLAASSADRARLTAAGIPEDRTQLWRPGVVLPRSITSTVELPSRTVCVDARWNEGVASLALQSMVLLQDPLAHLTVWISKPAPTLEQIAIDLGIAGQVTFVLRRAMPETAVFIAGQEAAFPISLLQAAGKGRVPIFIGVKTPEFLSHQKNVLLCEPSAPDIAQTIQHTFDQAATTQIKVGAAAVASAFTTTASATHLKQIYDYVRS